MSTVDEIRLLIESAFPGCSLKIVDESHKHEGHAGARPEGETHFRLLIVSEAFQGVSRLQRHRMVNDAMKPLLNNPVHALALTTRAPGEA